MSHLMTFLTDPWFYVAVFVASFVVSFLWGLISGKLRRA